MLKKYKKDIETITIEHLKHFFSETVEVKYNWGYPNASVGIIDENDEGTTSLNINFSLDTEEKKYSIKSLTFTGKGEEAKPNWATIESDTIEFLIGICREITTGFFTPVEPVEENTPEPEKEDNAPKVE